MMLVPWGWRPELKEKTLGRGKGGCRKEGSFVQRVEVTTEIISGKEERQEGRGEKHAGCEEGWR